MNLFHKMRDEKIQVLSIAYQNNGSVRYAIKPVTGQPESMITELFNQTHWYVGKDDLKFRYVQTEPVKKGKGPGVGMIIEEVTSVRAYPPTSILNVAILVPGEEDYDMLVECYQRHEDDKAKNENTIRQVNTADEKDSKSQDRRSVILP